jgi:mono/diheme cytochrome c family protein
MKNLKQILLGIAVVTVLMFTQTSNAQAKPKGKEWKVPAADASKKSTVKAGDAAAIADGKAIWGKDCKSCHGVKGLGDGTKADKIDISCGNFSSKEFQALTDGELFYKTKVGRKPMPSFKEKLSDSEVWSVVAYMRTLK